MSFTASAQGTTFEAGFFLVDDEQCLRESMTISANHLQKVTRNGRTIVPMGSVIPANGSSAVGILYEDIDVTDGDAFGSVVTKGKVYENRLPAAAVSDAKTALTGITFVNTPAINRPAAFQKFDTLTVSSVAGTASGDTKVTVTGHTLRAGESYMYKTNSSAAPAAAQGAEISTTAGWTAWNGTDDITATTGHKITVAVKNGLGQCVASGSTDVTSHA